METQYLLWSPRMQGWWTNAGNVSSDIKQAKQMGRNAAIAFSMKHMNNGLSQFGFLPVALDDLLAMGVTL